MPYKPVRLNRPAAPQAPASRNPRPYSQTPIPPPVIPTEGNGEGRGNFMLWLGLGALGLLIAVVALITVINRVYVNPRTQFDPNVQGPYVFERDALLEQVPEVPVATIFSEEKVREYWDGDGFMATFRIHNDPRRGYSSNEWDCSLDPKKSFAENNPRRRAYVAEQQKVFQQCIARFREALPIVRSVELYFDDTENVDEEKSRWMRSHMESAGIVSQLMPGNDTVKQSVFRISSASALNKQEYSLPSDSPREKAREVLLQGLMWLLEPRPASKESAVATGLFNALKVNRDVRKRRVYIFSDGMENDPLTVSFYRADLSPANWPKLDELITKYQSFPDLSYATVRWYVPPPVRPGDEGKLRQSRAYWEHVLREKCGSKDAEVIY